MNIGIIGQGFVGSAIREGLRNFYNILTYDINPDIKWESNRALSEAIGYILGMGYGFKVKPNAWAATKSADKASRS